MLNEGRGLQFPTAASTTCLVIPPEQVLEHHERARVPTLGVAGASTQGDLTRDSQAVTRPRLVPALDVELPFEAAVQPVTVVCAFIESDRHAGLPVEEVEAGRGKGEGFEGEGRHGGGLHRPDIGAVEIAQGPPYPGDLA